MGLGAGEPRFPGMGGEDGSPGRRPSIVSEACATPEEKDAK